MFHFEFVAALVGDRENDASACHLISIVTREVYLSNLHGAVNTASHILRDRVLADYVIRVQYVLVRSVVRIISNKTSHVHCKLWIRLLFLDLDHLVIIYGAHLFHLLVVLQ